MSEEHQEHQDNQPAENAREPAPAPATVEERLKKLEETVARWAPKLAAVIGE
ncbi:MAG TPA: hypothetical protein VGI28_01870 [Stellaceae bacterium]|jgi:hypothetical protein